MSAGLSDRMKIERLSLSDFRNHEAFDLSEVGDLTVFVGRNGVGKTNVLEGIQLMTSAVSFRHPQIAQLIRTGARNARISVDMTDGNRRLTSELVLEAGKKRYAVNGKTRAIADIRGTLPAVMFTPDDLALAKKSSGVKRDALDDLGAQLARNYYIVRRDFDKALRYKNRLLKDEAARPLIESINETLVTCASQLFCYRYALFNRMVDRLERNYDAIAQTGESFTATFRPSWNRLARDRSFDEQPLELADNGAPAREHVRSLLLENLERYYEEERNRKRSLVGPQSDEIEFLLAGRDASSFASQGQQRSIVLAWKLAEVDLIRQTLGLNPVLLLDDVMSELDGARREMLLRFVTDDIQTFITATDVTGFSRDLLERARVVSLPIE